MQDDGDEQMPLGAPGRAVVDGAQAEFGLQAAEHGFQIRQGEIGSPQPFGVPVHQDRYGGPALVVHGDSHEFIVDRPFTESQGELDLLRYTNITRLQVFGAAEVRAVRVSVDTGTPWLFGFEPLYNE